MRLLTLSFILGWTLGFSFQQTLLLNAAAASLSGQQTPTTKLPPVVPEFAQRVVQVTDAKGLCLWPLNFPQPLPANKLLHEFSVGDVPVEDNKTDWNAVYKRCNDFLLSVGFDANIDSFGKECNFPLSVQVRGIFWSPKDFIEMAGKVAHPLSPEAVIPEVLLRALNDNCFVQPADLAMQRANFVKHWLRRASELENDEKSLRSNMDNWVNTATQGKRILLFREMLEACQFPDLDVCDELQMGVTLVGDVQRTGMLPDKFKPALCALDSLEVQSKRLRPNLQDQAKGSGDDEIDRIVWEKTLEEVDCSWLRGPLQDEDVPLGAPITRRFGLRQRADKVRLIDDYTESNVNLCVNTCEAPVLHTIDVASAMLALWFKLVGDSEQQVELSVRTFDLKSAYRQVGLSEDGRRYAYLKVFNPREGKFSLFQSTVLPFGAIRSVHSFLRLSRALWWLGVVGLKLMWTSFYDDFICFTPKALERNAEQAIVSLFRLTGWLFAESGDKCKPFDTSCEALGVLFDVSLSLSGIAAVCNTDKRIAELCDEIDVVLKNKCLLVKQAQRLRGRMQFADAQIFGKSGKRCLRVLTDFSEGRRKRLSLKDEFFLLTFKEMLKSKVPRRVAAVPNENILVFTDACYERNARSWICGIGGVLVFPNGSARKFSLELDSATRQLLGECTKNQIIFEAETLAAVVALLIWKDFLDKKRCLFFVDNEGAKFALLRGMSDNRVVDILSEIFAVEESKIATLIWLCRVPSKSNIADEPSRGAPIPVEFHSMLDDSAEALTATERLGRNISNGEKAASSLHEKDWTACIALQAVLQLSFCHMWQCLIWKMTIHWLESAVKFRLRVGEEGFISLISCCKPSTTPAATVSQCLTLQPRRLRQASMKKTELHALHYKRSCN